MYIFNSCIKSKEHFSFEMFVVSSIYFADSTSNIYFCCLWAQAQSRMMWRPPGSNVRIWMSRPTMQWLWLDPIKRRFIMEELSYNTLRAGNIRIWASQSLWRGGLGEVLHCPKEILLAIMMQNLSCGLEMRWKQWLWSDPIKQHFIVAELCYIKLPQ